MSKYLRPEHPSYAYGQAWFLYAAKNHSGPGFCRLLLVEAKNHAAVAFLERVGDDGRVSGTVSAMAVFRTCPDIGIRSDSTEEVEFSVFANDVVDRARVDRDPLAVQAYREAVSPPRPSLAVAKLSLTSPSVPAVGSNYQEVLSVLNNVGFGEQAPGVLASLGDLESRPVEEVVKEAIDACKLAAV